MAMVAMYPGDTPPVVDFEGDLLAEAIALFERGDFQGAEQAALEAEEEARELAAAKVEEGSDTDGNAVKEDAWRFALDLLATAYEDTTRTEKAEALYLRMLAWREGAEQYCAGHFDLAGQLFKKSPEYRNVEESTWFLRGLRPTDGHAVPDVVGLLALGEQVAAKAAVAVWTLALQPKHRQAITESGGLELMTKAVAYHSGNAELQAAGCGTLRLLCKGHALAIQNREKFISSLGGAETLIGAMRSLPDIADVQREGCGALFAVANNYPKGARAFVDLDGMMVCVDAIVGCPVDEAVGDAACRALAALQAASQPAMGTSGAAAEDFEAIWEGKLRGERGRCLARCSVQLAKSPLPGRATIQSLLAAVNILVADPGSRHKALELVEPVVACMREHPGHSRIQRAACSILWQLTSGHLSRDEAVARVANAEGLATLVEAMRAAPCDDELQRIAIGAVRNTVFGKDEYKTKAVKAGGIKVTVEAMVRYPRDARMQDHAIGALTSLCDTLGRASKCARAGGIEAILKALALHAGDPQVAQLGCVILCMFCDDAKLRKHIVAAGALPMAKAISRTGVADAQRWGLMLLREVSDGYVA